MKNSYAQVVVRIVLSLLLAVTIIHPSALWACACGCGVFDVETSALLPTREGGMIFFEYDHQNQNRNWRGSSPSSADDNDDKKIISDFFTLGAQYMIDRRWGVLAQIPYASRYFKVQKDSVDGPTAFTHASVGDVRLKGLYAGFSDDMSTGLTFGVKLPTGSTKYDHFDPDVQIGSGSTDLLLGGYHTAPILMSFYWNWFANAEMDLPVIHYSGYRPGSEINAAVGTYFNHWRLGPVKIAPMAQVIGTHRWSDSGPFALSEATGYSRVLVAPGFEFNAGNIRITSDVGFRLYQYTTGDQLIGSQLYKLNIGYHF